MPYGSRLCVGAKWPVAPWKPIVLCRDCLRRLTPPDHVWQKFIEPAPAKHDGKTWACEQRITRKDGP